jgi:hypothetical protein
MTRKRVQQQEQQRKEEEAAVKLQAMSRGHMTRKRVQQQEQQRLREQRRMSSGTAATTIQSFFKGKQTKSQFEALRDAQHAIENRLRIVGAIARAAQAEQHVPLLTAAAARGWMLRAQLRAARHKAWGLANRQERVGRSRRASAKLLALGQDASAVADASDTGRPSEDVSAQLASEESARQRRASLNVYAGTPLLSESSATLRRPPPPPKRNASVAPKPAVSDGPDLVAAQVGGMRQQVAAEERKLRGMTVITFGLTSDRLFHGASLRRGESWAALTTGAERDAEVALQEEVSRGSDSASLASRFCPALIPASEWVRDFLAARDAQAAIRIQALARGHRDRKMIAQAMKPAEAKPPTVEKRRPRGTRNSLVSLATSVVTSVAPVIDEDVLLWARRRVLSVRDDELASLCSSSSPSPTMTVVAGALCVLLHIPNPTWKTAKRVMKRPGFVTDLAKVHPSQVNAYDKRVTRKLLLASAPALSGARQDAPATEARASAAVAMRDVVALRAVLTDAGEPTGEAASLHWLDPAERRVSSGVAPDPTRATRCLVDWVTLVARWRTADETPDDEDEGYKSERSTDSRKSSEKDDESDGASVASDPGMRLAVVDLDDARDALRALSDADLASLVKPGPRALATSVALAVSCVLCSRAPSFLSATILFAERPRETIERLASLTREDVPNKARLLLATLLGARRLTTLTHKKEEAMGPTLTALFRWVVSVLSLPEMPLRKIPQPRSARRSAARFVSALLEAKASDAAAVSDADTAAAGLNKVVSDTQVSDTASPALLVLSKYRLFGRESIAMMVLRAALRASAWRAKARVRRWKEQGVLGLLGRTPLGRARRGLLDLSTKEVEAFRAQKPPSRETAAIAAAVCAVLKEPPSWKFLRKILKQGSAMDFLCELDPTHIGETALRQAREFLLSGGPDKTPILPLVRASSLRTAKALYLWLMRLTDLRAMERPSSD